MDLVSDEFEKTFLGKTQTNHINKVSLQQINLSTSSRKQFKHQYNKHYKHRGLRPSHKTCSSLRHEILRSFRPGIHIQPTPHDLPTISTSTSSQPHIDFKFFAHLDQLEFIFDQRHTSYLGFLPVSYDKFFLLTYTIITISK